MPVAEVAPGIELQYIDSGVPEINSADYKTLLIFHGYVWSAETFSKTLPYASKAGIRIIAFNRRDYAPSTTYTPEEAGILHSESCSPDDIRDFMRNRSIEAASFIKHLVDTKVVVEPTEDGKGGIFLIGWSLGTSFALDFLDTVPTMSEELREVCKKNVKGMIVYDPPYEAVGLDAPAPGTALYINVVMARHIDPADPNNPENQAKAVDALLDFLSGYFEYTVPLPENPTPDDILKRYVENELTPPRESTRILESRNPTRSPSGITFMENFRPNAMAFEGAAVTKAFILKLFDDGVHRLLFAPASKERDERLWKDHGFRGIRYLYNEHTCWGPFYAAETSEKRFKAAWGEESFGMIKGGNHYVHWENPENFVESVVKMM